MGRLYDWILPNDMWRYFRLDYLWYIDAYKSVLGGYIYHTITLHPTRWTELWLKNNEKQ